MPVNSECPAPGGSEMTQMTVNDIATLNRLVAKYGREQLLAAAKSVEGLRQGPRREYCMDCDGCGWSEGSPAYTCHTCKGSGWKP
jgi:hypothetical protein